MNLGWFVSEADRLTMGLTRTVSGSIVDAYGASALNILILQVYNRNNEHEFRYEYCLYTTLITSLPSLLLKIQFFRLEIHFENYLKISRTMRRDLIRLA